MEKNITTIAMLAEEMGAMAEQNAITAANNIQTLDDVIVSMENIQKQMLWDKVCANSRQLDRLEEKMDRILEILGDRYGK